MGEKGRKEGREGGRGERKEKRGKEGERETGRLAAFFLFYSSQKEKRVVSLFLFLEHFIKKICIKKLPVPLICIYMQICLKPK